MPWNEADRERYNIVRERYTSGKFVRTIRRLKRGREGGEIDPRRLIRHLPGKVGELFDHTGPILRQEKARPNLARIADGGLFTADGALARSQANDPCAFRA